LARGLHHPLRQPRERHRIANNIEYGLSSSLYTKDVNKAFAAVRDLEAGITYINAPTIGAEVHLPSRHQGHGQWTPRRRHRRHRLLHRVESCLRDYSDTLQKAQIDRVD